MTCRNRSVWRYLQGGLLIFNWLQCPVLPSQTYHFSWESTSRTGPEAQSLCSGQCHTPQWQGNAKDVKKAFQRMFEKMGGFQVQAFTLQASGVGGGGGPQSDEKGNFHQNLTEEAIDASFDYIETHDPRTHHANTQLKWITKQFTPEESPIKHWPERLIKEALRNLMNDGVLALPVHDFPLTLVDVDPAVLFILEKLFPYFTDKALGMHGIPNVGKTPLGRIIAMAMSRYWVRKLNSKANLALGRLQSLISFRGEAGRKDRPDRFDDGSLPEQPMRKLKGVCDVGNTVLTKERWGAAKFPQNQMRIYMVNDLDLSAEPKYEIGMGTQRVHANAWACLDERLHSVWCECSAQKDMPLSDHKRFLVLASRNRGRGSSGTHAFGCTHVIAAKVRGVSSTCNTAKVTGTFLMISHYMFAGRKHGWKASWKTKEETYLQCQ